jgi:hypothetical protein
MTNAFVHSTMDSIICNLHSRLFYMWCVQQSHARSLSPGQWRPCFQHNSDTETPLLIRCVPLATEPGWLAGWLAGGPLLRVATIRRTTDTSLFISHTTNVPLFKFRCNIFICVRIINEMPVSVGSWSHRIISSTLYRCFHDCHCYGFLAMRTRAEYTVRCRENISWQCPNNWA